MRIRRMKYLLHACLRLLLKRHIDIFLCVFSSIIWLLFLIEIKSFRSLSSSSTCNSSSFEDLLNHCMLDDTPCYPEIEKALNRYFLKERTRFSMLLTYHPMIDCEHGRYLLINEAFHMYHGTGSQLMWYLGILNVAYKLNLTLVHLNWTAEHTNDENNAEREKYWQFFDWHIPYSAYQSCPQNSFVKRNIFEYDLTANQTLDQHYKGKQPFTITSHLKLLFDRFINNLRDNNNKWNDHIGFTFYSSRTFTTISSLMEVGVVFEIRWWLQHRKLYKGHIGFWSGVPTLSNYLPIDYFQYIKESNRNLNDESIIVAKRDEHTNEFIQCPSIDVHDVLLIGVHIRQGDVVKRDSLGRITSADMYRYVANSAYTSLLIFIIRTLPVYLERKYLITIYSEGVINDFVDILIDLKNALPESRCRLSFFLNGRTSETFNRLLRDDVLLGASSTFSLATGIFNSRQLKIGPHHNRARVHGMRNHLSLFLNENHTSFHLREEKQNLIKQRIEYVWQQKQIQLNTSFPLWLDNYLPNYPEEYML